jgi:hypothetical protein
MPPDTAMQAANLVADPLQARGIRPDDSTTRELQETREEGGPQGPEPTRFGDWERKGRCIDF